MDQRLSMVTLGVSDLSRSRAFYEGLGWVANDGSTDDIVFFQAGGMVVALWDRERLAQDSAIAAPPAPGAMVLAHNVRSPVAVDEVLAEAAAAGATITRPAATTFWGGYSGVFADPDGHPWEVAHNPHWTIGSDGSIELPG